MTTVVSTRPIVDIYANAAVQTIFNTAIKNNVTIKAEHLNKAPNNKMKEALLWAIENHTHSTNNFLCSVQLQLWNGKELTNYQIATAANVFKRYYADQLVSTARKDLEEREAQRPQLALGTYTVIQDQSRTYRTIMLVECPESFNKAPGTQIAKFLSGPDNTENYTGFAFVFPGRRPEPWKKYRSNSDLCYTLGLLLEHDTAAPYAEAYAIESKRCARCRKFLTVPASVFSGYGPNCAKKLGINQSAGSNLRSSRRPSQKSPQEGTSGPRNDDSPLFDD